MWRIAAGLLGLHMFLAWSARAPAITTGNDDAVYLLLARSLRSGRYLDLFYTDLPIHSQYPPLYPGFLALLGSVFGERLPLFLAANVALSAIALLLFFEIARRRDSTLALFALAIASTNPMLLALPGALRTEPLCMAMTGLSLWFLSRSDNRHALIGAGVAAIAAALTRSAAVTLVIAVAMLWLIQRRWRAVAWLGLSSGLTVGAWLSWTVVAPRQIAGRSYVADVTEVTPAQPPSSATGAPPVAPEGIDSTVHARPGLPATVLRRVRQNIAAYALTGMGALAVPTIDNTVIDNLAWLLTIVGFGGVGMWGMRRWAPGSALALACHAALLAVWPYSFQRYLAPVLPLGIIALFSGAGEVERRARQRTGWSTWTGVVPAVLLVGILAGAVPKSTGIARDAMRCRYGTAEPASCETAEVLAFHEATEFIRDSTADTARFLAAKEGPFYYYTGRRVLPIYAVLDGEIADIPRYLASNRTEYVFLSHLKIDEWAIARPLASICDRFQLVRAWGETTVLLRLTEGGTTSSAACDAIRDYATAPWGNRSYRRKVLP